MSLPSVSLPEGELRVAGCNTLDKLISIGDGDAALLYLYILRYGDITDDKNAARMLKLSPERYERALFTLHALITPQKAASVAPSENTPPSYTPAELRQARLQDHKFSAVCQCAEETLGRTLTDAQIRCLLTAYDFLGLSAEAIIELLSYLKKEKGVVRLSDIKHETYAWADMGIYTAIDAQRYLSQKAGEKPLSDSIYTALRANPESPSPKEQRVCSFALSHGFPADTIALAVARTHKSHGKHSLDYILGILRQWEQKGVHTVSEITAIEPESKAVGQTMAAPTPNATLAEWENEWLSRVKNHRQNSEES